MFPWFINNTLAAAGLALVVFLVCRFGRFRPAVQHALWLVVLVKLLTPAWLAWPWSPWDLFDQPVAIETASPPADVLAVEAATPAPASVGVRPALPKLSEAVPPQGIGTSLPAAAGVNKGRQAAHATPVQEPPPTEPWLSVVARGFWLMLPWLSQAVLYLWAVGAVVLLLIQSSQALRFRRLVARGEPVSGELSEELDRLAVRMRVSPPPARRVPDLVSPVLWCLGKPTLLWPSTLEENLASGATRSLLLHELAHLRRRDHWVAWLEGIGLLIWWWNPLFWYVRRRLRQCAEMACDAWVVWALPDARRTYAESLVAVTELASQGRAVVPAWGAIGEARNLERRLTMIFRNDVRRELSWSGLVMIVFLALVVLPGWSWGQAKVKPTPAEPQPASTPAPPTATRPPTAEPAEPAATFPPMPAFSSISAGEPTSTTPISPAVPQATPNPSSTLNVRPSAAPVQPPQVPGAGRRSRAPRAGAQPDISYVIQPTPAEMGVTSPPPMAARVAGPEAGPMSIRAFTLKNHDPAEMIRMINALWELSANQLAVIAFAPQAEGAMPQGQAPVAYNQPAIVPAPPEQPGHNIVAANQPSAFGAPGGGRAGAASPAPRLAADSPTKSLIVRGSNQQIEQVAQFVSALDTPGKPLSQEVEKLGNVCSLTPQHRSLEEIVNILQSLGIPVRTVPISVAGEKAGPSGGNLIAIGPDDTVAEIQQLVQSLDVEQGKPEVADDPFKQ